MIRHYCLIVEIEYQQTTSSMLQQQRENLIPVLERHGYKLNALFVERAESVQYLVLYAEYISSEYTIRDSDTLLQPIIQAIQSVGDVVNPIIFLMENDDSNPQEEQHYIPYQTYEREAS